MLVDPSTLFAFAFTSLIIELTPGPNMAYLAILTTTQGKRAGFSAVIGIALGLMLVGLAASAGLASLISQSHLLYQGLRWAGILYLLWLAWEGWQENQETSPSKTEGLLQVRYFYQGLITNLLNPKAALFYVAILPSFLAVAQPLIQQAIVLTLVYVTIATLVHSGIIVAAHASRRFFAGQNPIYIRRVASLLLVCVAIWFTWKTGH